MVISKTRIRSVLSCLIGTASFALAIGTFGHAVADMNVVGSTHGQNYQGVPDPSGPSPTPPGASYAVPLSLCDADSPTPHRYSSKANLTDLLDSSISMPVNTSILWVCKVGGTFDFKFRYTGGFSARAYAAIKAPLNDTGSRFTSVTDTGPCTAVNGLASVIDPGTGRPYISHKDCTGLELVNANFATSDTKGTAFAANMCDQTGACAAPILETNVQSFPITATPFVMIVGNGVQKCSTDPGHLNAAGGKISLTRAQVEAIFSGQVTNWNQLGLCVFPAATVDANGFPQLDPINTSSIAGVDQNIMTCSRPITAGTRIIFNATQMINAPEISQGSVGGGTPTYVPFTSAGGVYNWLAPTVSDGLVCVQGRLTPSLSPPNRNAIAYNRADEAANIADFGGGNVGRMVGGYPVVLDGQLPSNYVKPADIIHPTSDERRISQEDFRCGRYTFWADWVGIHRTSPLDVNQDLWKRYVSAIAANIGDSPAGFFWAKNLKFPGAPSVINSEMFVSKAGTKGPTQWNIGFPQDCR